MRANPVVVAATDELALRMAPRLRALDCREVRAHEDPLEVIRGTLAVSSQAWCWLIAGEPACMFGTSTRSLVGDRAFVWLLATDAINCDRRTFWLGSKLAVRHLLSTFPALEGWVDARFEPSVRWLEKLGFRLGEPDFTHGIPLRYFEVTR